MYSGVLFEVVGNMASYQASFRTLIKSAVHLLNTWTTSFVRPLLIFFFFGLSTHQAIGSNLCSELLVSISEAQGELLSIEQSFAQSGLVRYIYSGTEHPLGDGVLQLNRSYTIVVVGNTVVFGEGYVGMFAGTFQATHPKLMADASTPELMYQYAGRGGSILIKANGEFIISGYHNKSSSDFSANLISGILLEAAPNLRFRSTPHRLSEFIKTENQ